MPCECGRSGQSNIKKHTFCELKSSLQPTIPAVILRIPQMPIRLRTASLTASYAQLRAPPRPVDSDMLHVCSEDVEHKVDVNMGQKNFEHKLRWTVFVSLSLIGSDLSSLHSVPWIKLSYRQQEIHHQGGFGRASRESNS